MQLPRQSSFLAAAVEVAGVEVAAGVSLGVCDRFGGPDRPSKEQVWAGAAVCPCRAVAFHIPS